MILKKKKLCDLTVLNNSLSSHYTFVVALLSLPCGSQLIPPCPYASQLFFLASFFCAHVFLSNACLMITGPEPGIRRNSQTNCSTSSHNCIMIPFSMLHLAVLMQLRMQVNLLTDLRTVCFSCPCFRLWDLGLDPLALVLCQLHIGFYYSNTLAILRISEILCSCSV